MSIESIINYSDEEKVQQFSILIKDPTVQPVFRAYVESILQSMFPTAISDFLATSEHKVLKRLQAVEEVLGLDIAHDPDVQTIQDRIEALEALELRPVVPAEIERPVIPSKNITEIRADFLIDYILNKTHLIPKADSCFANVRAWVMNSKEFRYFVENELPVEYHPEPLKAHKKHWDGWRKLKNDVFEAVEKRFEQSMKGRTDKGMFVDKADHGRKELRLIYTKQLDAPEEEELLIRMGVLPAPSPTVTA